MSFSPRLFPAASLPRNLPRFCSARPLEAQHLLFVTRIKLECLAAGIARIETGPKGVIISFHNDNFKNPAGLAGMLQDGKLKAKLRPDHKLIIFMKWADTGARLEGILSLVRTFRKISEAA